MDEANNFKEEPSRKSCVFIRTILNNIFNGITGFFNAKKKSSVTSSKNPETSVSNKSLTDYQTLDDPLKTKTILRKSERPFNTDKKEVRFSDQSESKHLINVIAIFCIDNLNADHSHVHSHANARKSTLHTVSGSNAYRSNQIAGSSSIPNITATKSKDNDQSKIKSGSKPSTSTSQCVDKGSKTFSTGTKDKKSTNYNSGTSNADTKLSYRYSKATSSLKIPGNGQEITSTVITKTIIEKRNYSNNESTPKTSKSSVKLGKNSKSSVNLDKPSKSSVNLGKYFYVNVISSASSSEAPTNTFLASSTVANISDDQDSINQSYLKVSKDQKTASDDNLSELISKACKTLQFSDEGSDSHQSAHNFSDSDKGSSHSDMKLSGKDKRSSRSDLKVSDSDKGSSHSDLEHSDSDKGSHHSELKQSDNGIESSDSKYKIFVGDIGSSISKWKIFDDDIDSSDTNFKLLDTAQEFYKNHSSNPLSRVFYDILSKFRDVINSINEFPVIDPSATASTQEISDIFISRYEQIQVLRDGLRYYMEIFPQVKETVDTSDINSASVESEETSISSNETVEIVSESLFDVFKTAAKCYPINKFEIPPYEYAIDEKPQVTIEEKQDDSDENHLSTCNDHQKTLEGDFSNIDSHAVMVFDIEDCFSENSRIICASLLSEYSDCAVKLKLLLLRGVKDVSVEDYESRISKILSLDDELGYLSAKLIVTINDWGKQFQELNHNLQNDAQSKNSRRSLHYMGILRICVLFARILLTFTFEKQLKLEEYEKDLIIYHKRRN